METANRAIPLVLCALALAGCTPLIYGPMGGERNARYGYKDGSNENGRITVLVVVPSTSNANVAYQFWERRATELCGSNQYTKNIFRAVRATELYDYYGGRPGDYYLEGYVGCNEAAPQK